jgi:hypothetical protein
MMNITTGNAAHLPGITTHGQLNWCAINHLAQTEGLMRSASSRCCKKQRETRLAGAA